MRDKFILETHNNVMVCITLSCCSNQSFLLKLLDDAARTLPPDCQEPLSSVDVPKLMVAVYPRHVAEDMAAHLSLPLKELKLTVSTSEGIEVMMVGWFTIDTNKT